MLDLLDLVVDRHAVFWRTTGYRPSLREQFIQIRVDIRGHVERAGYVIGAAHDVFRAGGIWWRATTPTHHRSVEFLGQQDIIQVGRPFQVLYAHFKADLTQLVLRDQRCGLKIVDQRTVTDREGSADAIFFSHAIAIFIHPARFFQQRHRRFGIVGPGFDIGVVRPLNGRHHGAGKAGTAIFTERGDDVIFAVTHRYRLADSDITKQAMRFLLNEVAVLVIGGDRLCFIHPIHDEQTHTVHRESVDGEMIVEIQLNLLAGIHIAVIHFTAGQCLNQQRWIFNHQIDPIFDVGFSRPIGRVGAETLEAARFDFFQDVGPTTHRRELVVLIGLDVAEIRCIKM